MAEYVFVGAVSRIQSGNFCRRENRCATAKPQPPRIFNFREFRFDDHTNPVHVQRTRLLLRYIVVRSSKFFRPQSHRGTARGNTSEPSGLRPRPSINSSAPRYYSVRRTYATVRLDREANSQHLIESACDFSNSHVAGTSHGFHRQKPGVKEASKPRSPQVQEQEAEDDRYRKARMAREWRGGRFARGR